MSSLQETIDLVAAAQSGSAVALEELLQRYYPRVSQIVALRLGAGARRFADLEDVVQESLLDAFKGLGKFEARSEGSFRNWIAGVVENNIRDQARKGLAQKRGAGKVVLRAALGSTSLSESLFPDRGATPSELAAAREFEERLDEAVTRLEPRFRKVIELRRLCEMSYDEIADTMSLGGAASARSLFARAMSRLSSML